MKCLEWSIRGTFSFSYNAQEHLFPSVMNTCVKFENKGIVQITKSRRMHVGALKAPELLGPHKQRPDSGPFLFSMSLWSTARWPQQFPIAASPLLFPCWICLLWQYCLYRSRDPFVNGSFVSYFYDEVCGMCTDRSRVIDAVQRPKFLDHLPFS